ncbi:unnamed protein product [Closterium sp. NIES-65]|nr:unnamed protein product [Closterium sp. NIES-65]
MLHLILPPPCIPPRLPDPTISGGLTAYASCMGLPLFRRRIKGFSKYARPSLPSISPLNLSLSLPPTPLPSLYRRRIKGFSKYARPSLPSISPLNLSLSLPPTPLPSLFRRRIKGFSKYARPSLPSISPLNLSLSLPPTPLPSLFRRRIICSSKYARPALPPFLISPHPSLSLPHPSLLSSAAASKALSKHLSMRHSTTAGDEEEDMEVLLLPLSPSPHPVLRTLSPHPHLHIKRSLRQASGHAVPSDSRRRGEDMEVLLLPLHLAMRYSTTAGDEVEDMEVLLPPFLVAHPTLTTLHLAMRYSTTAGDEVEDMEVLLRVVKKHLPAVQGVSVGAIASDYQRERVEHVCSRLALTPLAYLWQRPQKALLDNMIASGIHAILIKVAALGLRPEKHLGKRLEEIRGTMHALAGKFGVNVCGEGGEYETLTLDCPLFKVLWTYSLSKALPSSPALHVPAAHSLPSHFPPCIQHARIVVDSSHIILHSPDPVAPVGVLRITAFHVARKTQDGAAAAPADAAAVPADAAAADVALPPPVIIDANDEDALNEDDNGTAVVPARGAAGRDSAEGGEGGKGDGVRVAVTVQRHGFTLIACDTEGHDANDLASRLRLPHPALPLPLLTWPRISPSPSPPSPTPSARSPSPSPGPTPSLRAPLPRSHGAPFPSSDSKTVYPILILCPVCPLPHLPHLPLFPHLPYLLHSPPLPHPDLASHVSIALSSVSHTLRSLSLSWAHALYVHLYLADMAQFGAANSAYVRHITEAECVDGVPSRSTVELPLGASSLGGSGGSSTEGSRKGCSVAVDVVAWGRGASSVGRGEGEDGGGSGGEEGGEQQEGQGRQEQQQDGGVRQHGTRQRGEKHVVHVKGVSCWAPSCIGPYSQGVSCWAPSCIGPYSQAEGWLRGTRHNGVAEGLLPSSPPALHLIGWGAHDLDGACDAGWRL